MSVLLVSLAIMCRQGIYIHGKAINSLIGPYLAYIDRHYMCEANLPWRSYLRSSHFNPRRPKELQRLTGNVSGLTYYDDSCWIKVVIDIRSNNQWKENAFVFDFKTNGCRAFKENIPGFYNTIFKQEHVKDAHCIMKPGVYVVNDTPIEWTFPKVPIMPYGHYRYRSWFGKAEKVHGCWAADCWVIPKPE